MFLCVVPTYEPLPWFMIHHTDTHTHACARAHTHTHTHTNECLLITPPPHTTYATCTSTSQMGHLHIYIYIVHTHTTLNPHNVSTRPLKLYLHTHIHAPFIYSEYTSKLQCMHASSSYIQNAPQITILLYYVVVVNHVAIYSETCLIRHSMGLEKNVGLGGCRITEG